MTSAAGVGGRAIIGRVKDRITVLLGVGAIVAAIVGGSCSTNARISDLAARLDRLDARVAARLDRLDTRLDGFEARLDGFSARLDGLDARLRTVEIALAMLGRRLTGLERLLLPTPAGGE